MQDSSLTTDVMDEPVLARQPWSQTTHPIVCDQELALPIVADRLLNYLSEQLGNKSLHYAASPTAITDGWETYTYRFQLNGNNMAAEWAQPLILRVHVGSQGVPRVRHEAAVQHHLRHLGYSVPEVIWHDEELHSFGGPFLIMEEIAGHTLLHSLLRSPWSIFSAPARMARMHAQLHALPTVGFPNPVERSLGVYLNGIDALISQNHLKGLKPGLSWLRAHRPPSDSAGILHLDFHPMNLLVNSKDGSLSVIDWTYAETGDPHADVATTLMLMECVPVHGQRLLQRCATRIGRPFLRHAYLKEYSRCHAIDQGRLAYYRAWAALRRLAVYGRWLGDGPASAGCKMNLLARLDRGHLVALEHYFSKWSGIEVHL